MKELREDCWKAKRGTVRSIIFESYIIYTWPCLTTNIDDLLMKKILFLFIALGILICPSTAIFAKGNEYTEGDLVYIIERGGIIITGYFGDEKTVVIPKSIAGMPVSEIGEKAFTGTYVTKIILPESIMKISEQSIPSNCQVEYESRGQSALEKNNPDKE